MNESQPSKKSMPCAFITRITGQDGSLLTDFLLRKGYQVHGLLRQSSTESSWRLDHHCKETSVYGRQLFFHYCDLSDTSALRRVLLKSAPDEVYHLAGQSHVGLSFEFPESTCEVTAIGTLRLLEVVRDLPRPPRLFHASSR